LAPFVLPLDTGFAIFTCPALGPIFTCPALLLGPGKEFPKEFMDSVRAESRKERVQRPRRGKLAPLVAAVVALALRVPAMASDHFYPIGKPGSPWGEAERAAWLARVGTIHRSYADEVLAKLEPLKDTFEVVQYGALAQDRARYPLFCVKTRAWDARKPCVLITGGVHGYETSGVQGALLFLKTEAQKYSERFNIAVCPCVCPWGYETIQRWTAAAVDPNRHFLASDSCEETAALMSLVASLGVAQWTMHLDLHETTDSDLSEFIPAKASRDGLPLPDETIPDGFYLIGVKCEPEAPQRRWLAAIIDGVRRVTHIAPPDANGEVVGEKVVQDGTILTDAAGRSRSLTNALFAATTEVYPDSKEVTAEQCNRAQVAAATAGLDFIVANHL